LGATGFGGNDGRETGNVGEGVKTEETASGTGVGNGVGIYFGEEAVLDTVLVLLFL